MLQVFKADRLLCFSLCCCDKQQKEKQLRKDRVDLIFQSQVTVRLWSVRQELKVGIGGRNHGGIFYSGFLLAHIQLPFSYSLAHVPRDGTAYSALGPPTSISNPDDAFQACSWTNLIEEVILHLKLPLMTVGYAK